VVFTRHRIHQKPRLQVHDNPTNPVHRLEQISDLLQDNDAASHWRAQHVKNFTNLTLAEASQWLAAIGAGLVNLYLNAIDATPERGKLIVEAGMERTDDTPPMVVITVADTGFGIAATDLAKIFQPFFTAKKRRGMGLGLPICRRIIKNHDGRIEVESQSGRGTSFKIHLPLEHNTAQ
jgi:signal transduction histidine kinase